MLVGVAGRRRWVPGMDMGSGGGSPLLVLAEIGVFWAAAVLHVLRILAADTLPDADRTVDAGHAAMGAGMVLMVFGPPVFVEHAVAGLFAAVALGFVARVRAVTVRRGEVAAVGAGSAAMAFMLAVPGHRPAVLTVTVAAVLAVCALVHAGRLLDARHRAGHGTAAGAGRVLVTAPHVGALVMTLAMAGMVAAA